MTTEEWRTIPGYEGSYEVSSLGRVRSLDRITRTANRTKPISGKILKFVSVLGYPKVSLYRGHRIGKQVAVHKLVALAFLNYAPAKGLVIRHLDDNPENNHVSNLVIGNQKENAADSHRNTGTIFGTWNRKYDMDNARIAYLVKECGGTITWAAETLGVPVRGLQKDFKKSHWSKL